MNKYTFSDFDKGTEVYHKTSKTLKMIVIGNDPETKEIFCRWFDDKDTIHEKSFFYIELVKCSDSDKDFMRFVDSI